MIPELRFPEFEGDLQNRDVLNSFCDINPNTGELPNRFIYIDLESVNKGRLEKENSISKEGAPSRAQRVLQRGDILYQTVRPYQKNNYFFDKEGDYVASTGYAQIRTNQDKKYFFQYIHTSKFVNNVLKRCTGTSYPAIGTTDLAKVPVTIPTPEEQTKIACFLSAVDKRINLLQKKKAEWERYKKGIMQQIFPPAGGQAPEIRFKQDDGNDFPDWGEKKLGEITKYYDGTHQTPKYIEKGIPFYSVEHVTANQFSNTKYISQEVFEKENKRVKLEKGDILMTRIGSIGKAKHIDWDVNASFYVSLALIKQNESFDSKFLSYAIN